MVAVVSGHICIDLVPTLRAPACIDPGVLIEVGPLVAQPGGSVANTGRSLAELGVPIRLAAGVGGDHLGSLLVQLLADLGMEAVAVRRHEGLTTSYSMVVEAPQTDRTFWHHVGANEAFDGSDVELAGADVLHVGYPTILPALVRHQGRALRDLLARAAQHDVTTAMDMATLDPGSPLAALDWDQMFRRLLPLVGVFAPSVDDIVSVLGCVKPATPDEVAALGRRLLRLGAAVVLLKAGAAGIYFCSADPQRLRRAGAALAAVAESWACRELWAPSMDVVVTHTTGAGDAAVAGALYGLVARYDAEAALGLAAGAAALRISSARPLPHGDELAARVGHDIRFVSFAARGWLPTDVGLARGPRDLVPITRSTLGC